MKMTGAQILLECLLEQGVDTVFGYPGGTILNVYDALYDYHDKSGFCSPMTAISCAASWESSRENSCRSRRRPRSCSRS